MMQIPNIQLSMTSHISENVKKQEFCSVILDELKHKSFMYAVKNHYWYQMYIDDLPIWGKCGKIYQIVIPVKT